MAAKKKSKKAKRLPAEVKTLTELARRLGVSRKTPGNWRKREGFPCPHDGPYNVVKVDRWASKMRSEAANRSDIDIDAGAQTPSVSAKPLSHERAEADLEFRKLKIERERLRNDELAGDLVPRSELIDLLVQRATELRRNLKIVPRNVTTDTDLQARIAEELESAMREYVRPVE